MKCGRFAIPIILTADNYAQTRFTLTLKSLSAKFFQARGYSTALIGKWHLGYGADNHPLDFGFDYHYGFLEAFSLYAAA